MADSDLITNQNKLAKEASEDSARLHKTIEGLLKNSEKPADRVKLLKMQAELQKNNRTLSGDLGKNISNMVDGFSTTVDGMINQTFGPLGGMVTSLTTGFLKRGKENRDNLEQNKLQNDNAEALIAKMGGVQKAVESINKKTAPRDLDAENAAKKGGKSTPLRDAKGKFRKKTKEEEEGSIVDTISGGIATAAGIAGGGGIIATAKALGGKYKTLVGKLTGGVAGRALSVANPVFAAISMGKDVFDIANAVTDDDVTTSVKNEDIGGLVGGFIGGAIGIVGGPAGVALGVTLGNMAGEFIGGAFDDPEVLGAISKVRDSLTSERDSLVTEITVAEEKLKDKNISEPMRKMLQAQIDSNTARVTAIDSELKDMESLKEKEDELRNIQKRSLDAVEMKRKLEKQLETAEERGDTARIKMLEEMIENADAEFDKQEKAYETASEELRLQAAETSKGLKDNVLSFFGRFTSLTDNPIANFFGSMFGGDGETETGSDAFRRARGIKGGAPGRARGGIIVNQPTYLPSSGIVVGEHGTYSGTGLAYGGIADGGPEAVIPLSSTRAGAFIDPMAKSVAGMVMNRLQMERMSGVGGGGGSTVVTDARSTQTNNNTTVINNPSPIGQMLPDEGRDFVSKVA